MPGLPASGLLPADIVAGSRVSRFRRAIFFARERLQALWRFQWAGVRTRARLTLYGLLTAKNGHSSDLPCSGFVI